MALTLRSWINKSYSIVTSAGNFDKNVRLRLHPWELYSTQAGIQLKPVINLEHVKNNQNINQQCKVTNVELVHNKKAKFHNNLIDVLDSEHHNSVANSVKLSIDHIRLASQLKPNIKQEADNAADFTENQSNANYTPEDRPSPDKLNHVYNVLADSLPKLFIRSLDYQMYHPDVIFEDNIHGRRTVGLYPYIKQISFLRVMGHLKFAYVKLDILKITQHPEDSTVKVRWTINGISGLKVILLFWKYRIWDIKKLFEKTVPWYDGFSTFYVNGDGKIYKHVVDKMMPDMDREESRASRTSSIAAAAKLSLIVGIIPKFSDINSFF